MTNHTHASSHRAFSHPHPGQHPQGIHSSTSMAASSSSPSSCCRAREGPALPVLRFAPAARPASLAPAAPRGSSCAWAAAAVCFSASCHAYTTQDTSRHEMKAKSTRRRRARDCTLSEACYQCAVKRVLWSLPDARPLVCVLCAVCTSHAYL